MSKMRKLVCEFILAYTRMAESGFNFQRFWFETGQGGREEVYKQERKFTNTCTPGLSSGTVRVQAYSQSASLKDDLKLARATK